jgi:hypothetical protein
MSNILNFSGWMRLNEQLHSSFTKFPADMPKEKATQIIDFLKQNGTSTGGWIVLDEDKEHIYQLQSNYIKGDKIMSGAMSNNPIDVFGISKHKLYIFSNKETSWVTSQMVYQDYYRFLSEQGSGENGSPIDDFNVVGVWGGQDKNTPSADNRYGLAGMFIDSESKEFGAKVFKMLGGTALEQFKKQITAIAEGNIPGKDDAWLKEASYKKNAKYILDQLG